MLSVMFKDANELVKLLQKISFDKQKDKLIFAGDLINKGPESLKTINYIMSLGSAAEAVLGNHEILFLAVSYNFYPNGNKNSFDDILKAPNLEEIQEWLCNQKLLIKQDDNYICHAGIPHIWSPKKALSERMKLNCVKESNDKKASACKLI